MQYHPTPLAKYEELNKAFYVWFLQKQAIRMPISGLSLTAKARITSELEHFIVYTKEL